MKIIAYLRVSTTGQDLNNQRLAILDYAHKKHLQIDKFIEAQSSSRKTIKERNLDQLFSNVHAGDLVLVSELSRLGRSVGQIIQLIDELIKLKVRFIAIKENIQLNGKQDIQSKMMITMFGLFAEIERDLISERTPEGLQVAKNKGKNLGRPKGIGRSKLDGKEAEIKVLLDKNIPKASIAKIMDVSRSNLLHFISSRHI
ncbi:MAG: recombinase family protein [Burkholderiales bacterium]|nr:recombinase family protein [Burkholderiales bacterium]